MADVYCRNQRVELAPLEKETVLFDPDAAKFFVLNRTSSFIWEHLSGPCTAHDLALAVCGRFRGTTPEQALSDAELILGEMASHGLIARTTERAVADGERFDDSQTH